MKTKVLLTGDRPTGSIHVGHYLGSIKSRVTLQDEYKCANIIADLHALTTGVTPELVKLLPERMLYMVVDYLACGIDPKKTDIFVQSKCSSVYKLHLLLSMFVTVSSVSGLPSIKDMAANAKMTGDAMSFGLLSYPVLQSADILIAQANLVPVGKDNLAHIEIARCIARKFNNLFGDFFVIPDALISEVSCLPGFDGKGKMSKSAGNAIFLSDSADDIRKKVRRIPTDPNRISASIPGQVDNNVLFVFHDAFNDDKSLLESLKDRYRAGTVGDEEVKDVLVDKLEAFIAPIRTKREQLLKDMVYIKSVLEEGTERVAARYDKLVSDLYVTMGLNY